MKATVIILDLKLDTCGNHLWVKEIRRSYFGTAHVKQFAEEIVYHNLDAAVEKKLDAFDDHSDGGIKILISFQHDRLPISSKN